MRDAANRIGSGEHNQTAEKVSANTVIKAVRDALVHATPLPFHGRFTY